MMVFNIEGLISKLRTPQAQAREQKSFWFLELLFGKHCFKQSEANYITYNKRLTLTWSGFKMVDSKVADYSMFDSYAYKYKILSLMQNIKPDGWVYAAF